MDNKSISRRSFLITAAGSAAAGTLLAARPGAIASASSRRLALTATTLPRHETLVVSLSDTENEMSDVDVCNPFVTGTNRTGWHFAYEPLFFYDPWWTSKVSGPSWIHGSKSGEIPYLATGYSYNKDYTAVTIKLRPHVTWSDGQPFTSSDVAFTFNMLKAHAPTLTWSPDIALYVKSVETPDDLSVHLTLNGPNPRFMLDYLLWHQDVGFPMVPAHIWRNQNPTTFTNLDLSKGWPVVTGPWQLVSSTTEQKIWQRRDNWWGAKTGFRRLPKMRQVVVLPLFEGSKLVELLVANQVDATHNLIPTDAQVAVAKNPKLLLRAPHQATPWGWLDFYTNFIAFNCASPPYDDSRMRWAINYAINREQIVDVGFQKQVPSTVLPISTYTPLQPYFKDVDDILKRYPIGEHDPKKSAQLMQAMGYTRSSGRPWSKNGQELSVVIDITPGFAEFETAVPIIIAQLTNAGFNAGYKAPTDLGTLEGTGSALISLQGAAGNSVRDPFDEIVTFDSRYSAPVGQVAVYPYRWKDSLFNQAMTRMQGLPAPSAAFTSAWHQAMERWIPGLPVIPTVQNVLIIPVNTTYWKGWPVSTNSYCAPSMWHRGSAGLVINTLEPA